MSTHNIPFFNIKKENIPKLSQICNYGICSKELKNEFETAVVNEPSVFEPLKFYCSLDTFPYFNLLSFPGISNYWYLKGNFLDQKIYFEISVV